MAKRSIKLAVVVDLSWDDSEQTEEKAVELFVTRVPERMRWRVRTEGITVGKIVPLERSSHA